MKRTHNWSEHSLWNFKSPQVSFKLLAKTIIKDIGLECVSSQQHEGHDKFKMLKHQENKHTTLIKKFEVELELKNMLGLLLAFALQSS